MLVGDGVEEPFDVLFRADDARQAEDLDGRVVRMDAHVHPALLADGHDRLQEVFHVGPELGLVDALVQVQELAELLHGGLVVLAEIAAHEALRLDDDGLHQLVVLFRGHGLGERVGFGEDVPPLAYARREPELRPLLPGAGALEDVDVEIGELGVVEIQVRGAVRVLMEQVRAGPVQHRHEVVADAVDALGGEVPQRLLVHFDLLVPVGTAVFDGLHDGERLHDAPAHAVALDILAQVADLLPRPHLSQRDVVQGGHDALHADLPQHRQRDLVFLTEPSPGFFHGLSAF